MKIIFNAFAFLILLEVIAFALFAFLNLFDLVSMIASFMAATAISCVIALEEKKKTLRQQGPERK